jgi:small subunit ribosomal protein S2
MSTHTNNTTLIERLFSVGAHFGFKKSRRHPTVTPYLFATKEGNDIFDLEKTASLLAAASEIVKEAGANGKTVLFVGTKTEVVEAVAKAAATVSMPYVVNRWIGGMLSNFSEMKKRINRLAELESGTVSGELERKYTKKERMVLGREATKLDHNFKGISTMTKLPDLMVVVDPRHDHIAVKEARAMRVPVIGIMSSDCDTTQVTYPVVINDSLQGSVALALSELTNALAAGQAAYIPKPVTARTESRPRTTRPAARG